MLISQRSQQDNGEQREKFNPWSAYSDMYCSLLLIFMLLFFFAILNYLELQDENAEETARVREELVVTRAEQEELTGKLSEAREYGAFYEEEYAALEAEAAGLRQQLSESQEDGASAQQEAGAL